MTIKVTLLLSTTLFEYWLPNIYFGYHCARAQQFFDSAKDSRLFCKALYFMTLDSFSIINSVRSTPYITTYLLRTN